MEKIPGFHHCIDDKFDFNYISQLHSKHSKNKVENPKVSFPIFHSRQREGTGNGVHAKGNVELIEEDKIDAGLKWYKTTFIEMRRENFIGDAPYRFYKITSDKF